MIGTSMSQLAAYASSYLRAPVLNRTGLSEAFDYQQRFARATPLSGEDESDSLLAFIKEIGLELKKHKGPVETFVIDHAARPSPN